MRFLVLGSLEVCDDRGRVITVTSRRQRQLLSVLLMHAGSLMSDDRLTELVWGEERPPDLGVRALRTVVSRLRSTLHGPDNALPIVTKPNGYILDRSSARLDADAFEELARAGRRHLAAREPDLAIGAFEDALSLWRGRPYAEFADETWARAEVTRLEELCATVREGMIEARLQLGGHAEVVSELEHLIDQHPLRERPREQLMLALCRSGRQADALRAYQDYRNLLAVETGLEPSPAMQALERQILSQDDLLVAPPAAGVQRSRDERSLDAPPVRRVDCPRPSTEWFGDSDDIRRIVADLQRKRVITLTGPGGVGKSRIAIEVGLSAIDDFAEGVRFVELATIADPDLVVISIASSWGVQAQKGRSMIESIVDWLSDRSLLVVLDNCEQVLAPLADLVDAIVHGCPKVRVLATSRESLEVTGEHVVRISPMTTPVAVEFFRDRALAAGVDIGHSERDIATIAAICERLDGIPLAIELTAARARSASLDDLLARLDDRLRLLRRSSRRGPERHQTMRAAIDWSYQLLDAAEQRLFVGLSVMSGTFDSFAVEALYDGDGADNDVRDLLDGLVAKSMVVVERRSGATRYRLLETIRQFGEERLVDSGSSAGFRDRHLAHFLDVAERAHQVEMTERQDDGQRMFDDDWDNLRAAHHWAVLTSNMLAADRIVKATTWYAGTRMRHEQGEWAVATIRLGTADAPAGASTFGGASRWAMLAGDDERALELARAGVAAAPSPDHPDAALPILLAITALAQLGRLDTSEFPEMRPHVERIVGASEDPWIRSTALCALFLLLFERDPEAVAGVVAIMAAEAARVPAPHLVMIARLAESQYRLSLLGDPDGALQLLRVNLDCAQQLDDRLMEGQCHGNIVVISSQHRLPGLRSACRSALAFLYDVRNWTLVWLVVECAAAYVREFGDAGAAVRIYGYLESHGPAHPDFRATRSANLEHLRWHPQFDELSARGAAMAPDEIVTLLLRCLEPSRTTE